MKVPKNIMSLEKIKLGGIDQWIYIRGKNTDNPILLYLHGGPGMSWMHIFRHFQAPLEDYFLVVQWEQRGSGKSYSRKIPKETMTIEQFISDLHELIEMLRNRFNKEKIFLMGHSWGSILGTFMVQRYPELFYAYIGMGQVTNMMENEKMLFQFTLDQAVKRNNKKAIKELKKIGPPFEGLHPPYENVYKGGYNAKLIVFKWLINFVETKYDSNYSKIDEIKKQYSNEIKKYLEFLYLSNPEYKPFDIFKNISGGKFSTKTMTKEILTVNLFKQVPELKVPVYIIIGRNDRITSAELAKKYFDALKAPKKEVIWFEKSYHAPNLEEPEKFNRLLIERILLESFSR